MIFCNEVYHYLYRALKATLLTMQPAFTGQIRIELNFHEGTLASATAAYTEGAKLGIRD